MQLVTNTKSNRPLMHCFNWTVPRILHSTVYEKPHHHIIRSPKRLYSLIYWFNNVHHRYLFADELKCRRMTQ